MRVPRSPRNSRRTYDAEGHEIRPMSLANMRAHSVRAVLATCQEASCGPLALINVDGLRLPQCMMAAGVDGEWRLELMGGGSRVLEIQR